jgi:flagellar basal body rod protein FlgG
MAEMIKALRALEANLQMVRIQDATLERTVNELARPAK